MTTPFEFSLFSAKGCKDPADPYLAFFRDQCRQRIFDANAEVFAMADGKIALGGDAEQRLRSAIACARLHVDFLRQIESHFEAKPEIRRQFTSVREAAEPHVARALAHAKELALMFDPLRAQSK